MTNDGLCTKCRRPLPAGSPRTVCAVCLFNAALLDPRAHAVALGEDAVSPASVSGRRVGGYELEAEISRGGMGVVYRARQLSLDRVVALKMILAGQFAGEAELGRFRAEAGAVAALEHPNIVPIFEVGDFEGRPFFSMKFMEGGPLSRRLATGNSRLKVGTGFTLTQAAALVSKLARAVHHAHERGILHRDLKPANILFDARNEPYLADFGLAKILGDAGPGTAGVGLTVTGAAFGTPEYMAPEQAAGKSKATTTAADIYSLGAILYELIAGRPPFRAASPLETMRQVMEHEPPRPSSIHTRVDRDLATICLKCLEKEPLRRYPSALALAEDLERWQRREPILARPAPPWEQLLKWARRHPARAGLLVVALLAPAIIIAGLSVTGARVTRERNLAREQVQITRQNLYAGDVALGFHALEENDFNGAWRSVDAQRPREAGAVDLRGFEWRLLAHATRGESRRTFDGAHLSWVNSIAWSPDGRSVVSSSVDGTTKLWDANEEKFLLTLVEPGHPGLLSNYTDKYYEVPRVVEVRSAFTADNLHVLTCANRQICLWERASGKLFSTITTNGFKNPVCSPVDPNLAFVSPHPESRLLGKLDLAQGIVVASTNIGRAEALTFTPDGKRLAYWDVFNKRIVIIRAADNAGVAELDTSFNRYFFVQQIAFTPDGNTLAACDLHNPAIELFDVPARRHIGHLEIAGGRMYAVAISADGRWLAAGGTDQAIHVWDLATRVEVGQLRGHRAAVYALAFSPDGRRLVSGGYDGTVRFWDVTPPVAEPELTNVFSAFAFSADGRRLLTQSTNGYARLWELPSRRLVREWASPLFQSALVLPNGAVLAACLRGTNDPPVLRWMDASVPTPQVVRELEMSALVASCSGITLSPDGRFAATGYRDGSVGLWDVAGGKLLQQTPGAFKGSVGYSRRATTQVLNPLAFSADGRVLAAASFDRSELHTWKIPEWHPLGQYMFGAVYEMPFALSPDGGELALGGLMQGNTVNLWDSALQKNAAQLSGHQDFLFNVAYAPDGRTLASGGRDGQLKLWHLVTRRELATLLKLPPGRLFSSMAFSPNGEWLGVSDSTGTLHLFHAPAVAP